MSKITRGNVDAEQLKSRARQGDSSVAQMFGGGDTFEDHLATYDANGNVIDGGVGLPSSGAGAAGGWFQEAPIGALNGSTTHYELSFIPNPLFAILELNGAVQSPYSDYTLNSDGSFDYTSSAPDSASHHTIWYFRGDPASSSAISGYAYKRAITIDHTKVPSTQSNFPVLVSGTYPSLKTVANGGRVQNSSGYDIIFCASISGASPLDFELESYDPATGQIAFWVNVPTISSSSDTTFYMFYANSGISTFQGNAAAVWDADFKAVYHCNETGTPNIGNTIHDSTSNARNLGRSSSSNRATAATGKIDGGLTPDPDVTVNGGYSTSLSGLPTASQAKTLECWFNFNTHTAVIDSNLLGLFGWGQRDHNGGVFGFVWHNTGKLMVDDSDSGFWGRSAGAGIDFTADTSWHHVVVTSAASNTAYSAVKMYLDGALQTLTYSDGSIDTYTGAGSELSLGNLAGGGNAGFGGLLDECRISAIERSADWISAGYNNQSSPATFYSVGTEQPV